MDLLGVILLIVVLVLALKIVGLVFGWVWTLLVGLVIGLVARSLLPGSQHLGWFRTAVAGALGSFVGHLLAGRHGMLVSLVAEVACAMGVVSLMSMHKRLK